MNSSWCPWSIPVYEELRNGPYCLRRNFRVSYFLFHCSSALLQVMRLIVFEIKLNAFLHIVTLVSCHCFLSVFLCFSNLSKPGIPLFSSESLTLLVDSLYAKQSNGGCKFECRFIGLYPRVNFYSR
jgi:hypothetical protein